MDGFHDFIQRMGFKRVRVHQLQSARSKLLIAFAQVHLFGASLGGFLVLHYTSVYPQMVDSLALCNGFSDTTPFHQSNNWLRVYAAEIAHSADISAIIAGSNMHLSSI